MVIPSCCRVKTNVSSDGAYFTPTMSRQEFAVIGVADKYAQLKLTTIVRVIG